MKLPRGVSGKDVTKVLKRAGFIHLRTTGSHYVARKDKITVVVPLHKELKTGTLKGIIEQSELPIEKFLELL